MNMHLNLKILKRKNANKHYHENDFGINTRWPIYDKKFLVIWKESSDNLQKESSYNGEFYGDKILTSLGVYTPLVVQT